MHLALPELPELIQEIASGDDDRSEISRVTFCGGCGFATAAQKIEQRVLDAAESARIISSQIRQRLEKAIGGPSNTAASVVAAAALA